MSKFRDIFLRQETGKTWEQLKRRTTARQVVEAEIEDLKTQGYPRRYIAQNSELGRIYLTETDRTQNTHIIGTTEQGKSKLLEMLMSMDVWNLQKTPNYKSGFCFIDSTEKGKTMYKVLKYCIKKDFKKVLVIDPRHIEDYGYVVPINPIDYDAPSEAIAAHVIDSLRVLWGTKDFKDESIITKYAPYFLDALHHGHYTLPEIENFAVPALINQREQILHTTKKDKDGKGHQLGFITRTELERVYKDKAVWLDVQATLRRFDPFRHSVMKMMLGSQVGINFQQLIRDGWVILCNLHPDGVFDTPQQRLLGTIIINEIIRARQRMTGYDVPYHIYIDEFGHYATRKIEKILMYERHLRIYLTLAHQGFFQIADDPKVKAAVKAGCKCKFLFWTADDKDLYEMIGMMYGGELKDRDVKAVLDKLKARQAAMKIGKQPAHIADLRDWPDVDISEKEVKDFLNNQFISNPTLYRPRADVWEEITNRFAVPTFKGKSFAGKPPRIATYSKSAPPAAHLKPETTAGDAARAEFSAQEDNRALIPQSILDDIANRPPDVRGKGKRPKGKRDPTPAEAG